MKSQALGKNILEAEVAGISHNGLWLLVQEREYFLPFKDFPWFKDAKLSNIYNVQLHHGYHLHWPDLDIDLEINSIESLEQFPLVYH